MKAKIFKNTAFTLLGLSFILPFILVLSVSISDGASIAERGYGLFPGAVSWEGYLSVLSKPYQLIQSYKITILFSLANTAASLLAQSMIAYTLSRKSYRYRKFLTVYIFITMVFGGGLVPSYILNSQYLHLNNTVWIYILPSLVSAWNIIVIRTFFSGLPEGLVEASKIDGASEFRTYFQIILPISKPVLATIGFMTLLSKWNDWHTSLIYIRDAKLYSLQYLLQRILRETEYLKSVTGSAAGTLLQNQFPPTDSMKFAMAVIAAGPMLVIFPFFQKYFTKGLTVGSIKG
jgi:putative aldouronate transport system permease protein